MLDLIPGCDIVINFSSLGVCLFSGRRGKISLVKRAGLGTGRTRQFIFIKLPWSPIARGLGSVYTVPDSHGHDNNLKRLSPLPALTAFHKFSFKFLI